MPGTFFQDQYAKAANALFGDPLPPAPGIMPEQDGGSEFTGSGNLQAESDRYTDKARAGGAPFTGEGVMAAFGNAMGLMGGAAPVQTGITSMAERALGLSPGALGGITNIPGHFAIKYDPRGKMTLTQYHDAYSNASREAKAKEVQRNTRGASPPSRMGRGFGGGGGGARSGGGIGSGNATGGPGFGTAR